MKQKTEVNHIFEREVILCGACGANDASHSVSVRVVKGLGYRPEPQQLYHVEYAVCGPCAREVVEVKLAAGLATADKKFTQTLSEAGKFPTPKRKKEIP